MNGVTLRVSYTCLFHTCPCNLFVSLLYQILSTYIIAILKERAQSLLTLFKLVLGLDHHVLESLESPIAKTSSGIFKEHLGWRSGIEDPGKSLPSQEGHEFKK